MAKYDEYDQIFGSKFSGDEDFEDFTECGETMDEVSERMKGTIASGDCVYCGGNNTMTYEGDICFVCSECKRSIHEDLYYWWASGHDIETED